MLEQFGQHPQQKGGVQAGCVHQLVGGEDVDDPLAVYRLHEVVDVQHGLAEELVAALGFDLQQAALYGAHAGGRHIAVLGGEFAAVVAHVLQHRAQVFQVEQQQAVVVGDLEDHVEHATLGVVQVQHAAQQQRAHVGHGGPHRVALLAKHIPQGGRAGHGFGLVDAALFQDTRQLVADMARLADAGQVAFDIGHKHRHADFGEILRQGLQRDGFAGAGSPGDQAVAIRQRREQLAGGGGVFGD